MGTINPGGKLAKNGNQTALKETHNQSEKASMKFDMSACSARSLQYLSSTSVSSASTCVLLSSTPSSCADGCPESCDIFAMSTALFCSLSTRVTAIYPVSAYYSTSSVLILLCLLKAAITLQFLPEVKTMGELELKKKNQAFQGSSRLQTH